MFEEKKKNLRTNSCRVAPHTIVMAEEGCKLFVYGIDQNMSNGDIQSEFEKFGAVTDVYNTGKG